MKTISQHLGQIIIAMAAVALLVCAVVVFKTDIGGFFNNVIGKETAIADEVLENMDGLELAPGESIQVFYQEAPKTLTFRSEAPLSEFKEVQVNGIVIDSSNYVLTEGSTIVTLTVEYLGTLPEGTYTMTIVSESGSVTITFKVVEDAPEEQEMVMLGDVDQDGKITGRDVSKAAFFLQKSPNASSLSRTAADVNEDGVVNQKDIDLLKPYQLGKDSSEYEGISPNIGTYVPVNDENITIEYYPNLVGDVNGDGHVAAADYNAVKALVCGTANADDLPFGLVTCDANGDKIINQTDVDMIKSYYFGETVDGSIVGQYRHDVDNSEYTIEYTEAA